MFGTSMRISDSLTHQALNNITVPAPVKAPTASEVLGLPKINKQDWGMYNAFKAGNKPAAPPPPKVEQLPTDFRSKWYALADKVPTLQNQKDMDQVTASNNAGLAQGLGALGFRGNQNSGSMERLAAQAAGAQGAAGLAAGQSRYNDLAKLYSEGLQKIDIPTAQGADMQNALKAGQGKSGLFGLGIGGIL